MKLELQMRTENVDFARYETAYFSEEFNQMAMAAAKLREREVRSFEVLPDGRQERRVRMVPDIMLPFAVAKLLQGRGVEYREITVFDPRTRTARLDIRSPAGKLVRVGGDVRFVEERGGVTLHFSGEVSVRVFGLGTLIEKLIIAQVKERYAAVAPVLQRYLDGQPRA